MKIITKLDPLTFNSIFSIFIFSVSLFLYFCKKFIKYVLESGWNNFQIRDCFKRDCWQYWDKNLTTNVSTKPGNSWSHRDTWQVCILESFLKKEKNWGILVKEKDDAQKQKQKLKTYFKSSYSFIFQKFISSSFLHFPLKSACFQTQCISIGVIQKVRHTQNCILER